MGRKKKEESTLDNIVAKADEYRCSLCGFVARKVNDCDHHILVEHQGQALINEDRPMNDIEIRQGYRRALTVLKQLRCPICSKTFRSFLGMVFHAQICGKSTDQLFRECEICGKRLKIHSLAIHLRSIHSTADPSIDENDNNDDNGDDIESIKDISNNRGKKRNSALKAIKKFQSLELADDEDEDDRKKSKKTRLKNDDDEDFSAKSSADENDDELEVGINLINKIEPKTTKTLNDKDLEHIISLIVHHIIREDGSNDDENGNQKIEKTISKTVAVNPKGLYSCYNSMCPTQFKYRFELENHYRRCRWRKFWFQCSLNECQQQQRERSRNRFNWLDTSVVEHFFHYHDELFDDELKEQFDIFVTKKQISNQIVQSGSGSRTPHYLEQLLEWHKQTTISLSNDEILFSNMLPKPDDYRIINRNFSIHQNCPTATNFKSTISMDSGDNQMKHLSTFESIRLDDNNLMFNVGNCVSAIAWCPIPFTIESTGFDCRSQFDQILMTEMKAQRDQYLILATSNFDELLQNERPDQICLQLWNVGPLNSVKNATTEECNMQQARLALNIDWTSYGDVLEICWCPWGVSYEQQPQQQPQSSRLKRLGLVAIASEDGHIRILSIPHPNQLDGSYNINYLLQVEPILVLQDRFPRYLNCNSIDWYPFAPYNMIVGAFNTGVSCLWRLPVGDEQPFAENKRLLPYDENGNLKCQPLLSIQWLNRDMYVCSSLNHSFIYHIHWDGLYRQIECRPCQKILVYQPLWTKHMIQMAMVRKGSLIGFYLLDIPVDSGQDNRHTIISNADDNYTDMSLSPWMYLIAYASESGKLFTTKMLKKPGCSKNVKSGNYILYATKLANMDLDRQNNSQESLSIKKCVMINECLDLNHQMDDFFDKYFFIYEDCQKPDAILQGRTASSNVRLLTKNDLYRYYAINKCCWNPNLSSYSWIFSSNKSGLCRLNRYPLINPKQMY